MLTPLPATDPVARAVAAWLKAGHVTADAPLLVACSGGADSLALAAAVVAVAASGREVAAAVIDHGLQAGSAGVAAQAADALHALGLQRVTVRRVQVGTDGGMEAAARAARYAALLDLAATMSFGGPGRAGEARPLAVGESPGAAVLLAHTADDQAETVLLGLSRGSGPRSIAGMGPWTAPWGRPLLAVRRADTERACRTVGLVPWMDPQNSDPAFTRVRLRREVLPLLDDVLGGGVVPALARTAELMADDLAALDQIAVRALAEIRTDTGDLDCPLLREWPSAVRRRVLRTWAQEVHGLTGLTYQHLVRLEDVVIRRRSGPAVRLPGAVDAVRDGRLLRLRHVS